MSNLDERQSSDPESGSEDLLLDAIHLMLEEGRDLEETLRVLRHLRGDRDFPMARRPRAPSYPHRLMIVYPDQRRPPVRYDPADAELPITCRDCGSEEAVSEPQANCTAR